MANLDDTIRAHALLRVAAIFDVPIESLRPDLKWGEDLVAGAVSNWRYKELDMIERDIRQAADPSIADELSSGRLVITTLGDYCDHMVRCHLARPEAVETILAMNFDA
jgi:hypothetical protein